jgi:hypothetical protein
MLRRGGCICSKSGGGNGLEGECEGTEMRPLSLVENAQLRSPHRTQVHRHPYTHRRLTRDPATPGVLDLPIALQLSPTRWILV